MFHLLEELDPKIYTHIVYVVANSDTTSIMRLKRYIDVARGTTRSDIPKMARVHRLPRPREVHQSYISSILPTLYSIYHAMHLLIEEKPDLILANGPGMCVPLMYIAFLYRLLGLPWVLAMIFVESLCRVRTLSLSGKLVYPIVDQFVVHWPSLKKKYSLADVCDVFVCQKDNNNSNMQS
ncbi:hypothetical protein ACHAW6_004137 [Cyclotella cf. meneghiniana]